MSKVIGKVAATEKSPTTIDEFFFWTDKSLVLSPFDVIKVEHLQNSFTFGVIEEISHITDATSYLTSYISSDFGDVSHSGSMHRVGMNFVKARVVGNTKNIYTPVLDARKVSLANAAEVKEALGLNNIKHSLVCGYLEMYEGVDRITLPVYLNAQFLIGPEGAHLNISGISGLAAKTSYAMFLTKAIQEQYVRAQNDAGSSVAFVFFNVKGKDLLAIDEPNEDLSDEDKSVYKMLGLKAEPFCNVKYFYPHSSKHPTTYADKSHVDGQIWQKKAFKYKYLYEDDKQKLDLLFANIEDSTGTMESIVNYIETDQGNFSSVENWQTFIKEVGEYCQKQSDRRSSSQSNEITVASWRKFKRIVSKILQNDMFANRVIEESQEVRLTDVVAEINKNDVLVVDIAKLDEDMQGFVFGDMIRAIYELKLGQLNGDRSDDEIPSKIIIFVDELNKYASTDVPKNSPILRQILDITERGRSLGIVLFSAEQFKSSIHDRIKGNCSTHAYGRTNAIEISKNDYRFVPSVYKNMMTRLAQGEYIMQNPILRTLLNIKFPKPIYKQFKS
jgi:uncharacterized protein